VPAFTPPKHFHFLNAQIQTRADATLKKNETGRGGRMCALQSIRALCRNAVDAHAAGNGVNADFLLHQACTLARGLKSPVLEAKLLNIRAVMAAENRRTKAAQAFLSLAQAKVDAHIGQNNKLYAVISGNLRRVQLPAAAGDGPARG
jgi:hypothetical protein